MPSLNQLKKELRKLADPKRAKVSRWFFKTGPGEYGAGDRFIGIKVPTQRSVAKKYNDLSLADIQELLKSKIHEHRLVALLILINKYKRSEALERKKIAEFYLKNAARVNNWDLVDLSCPNILGDYLLDKSRKALYELAGSKNLWQRRIAIVSTYAFIRERQFSDTLKIAKILLNDKHDLIHKAVGWMLREVGKRDRTVLEKFLRQYAGIMPRVMLRYAIEKFSQAERRSYLKSRLKDNL